jgi:type I restriction enzyme S subunit
MNSYGWSVETVESCLDRVAIPSAAKLQTKDYRRSGKYPVIDQGQAFIAGWTDDEAAVIAAPLPLIVFGDHTRAFKFVDFAFVRGADGTQLLNPRYGINPLYFYYACRAIDLPSRGYNRHFTILKNKEIRLAPRDEQQEIARVLRRVESGLEIQNQQLQASENLKRAAMRELFTRGLRGEAQKETEIGSMPESWEVVWVEDNAFAISKGASPKWQGFDYVNEGVLFIRSQNVGDGFMLWQDRAFLPVLWNEKEKRSILRAGDVLINLVGASIGRCTVGGREIEGANCNQAVCFVRLDQNKILPEFLSGFLLTAKGQQQIHGNKKDIARANLSLQDVRQTVIPKPPIEEQREIVAVLSALDRKIDLHRKKRAVLDKLFRALLHKLMTIEIRVADLDLTALTPARLAAAAQ